MLGMHAKYMITKMGLISNVSFHLVDISVCISAFCVFSSVVKKWRKIYYQLTVIGCIRIDQKNVLSVHP